MKVLLLDDHAIIRFGLSVLIKNKYSQAKIYEAADENSLFKILSDNVYFNICILDAKLPNTDIASLIEHLIIKQPDIKILILTSLPEIQFYKKFLKLGVKGFLNKECEDKTILEAINLILNNKYYISENVKEHMVMHNINSTGELLPFENLSPKELSVAMQLLGGKGVSEIAADFNLHVSSIATYRRRILDKCGVQNIYELMELAKNTDLKF